MLHQILESRTTGALEEIGLYNLLNRIARGEEDIDGFLLDSMRQRGFVEFDGLSLTEQGIDELKSLTIRLGWVYPEV